MQSTTDRELIPVPKGALMTLEEAVPVEIACESGAVWITQDNDIRDVVLNAGERFVSDRPGNVLVYALQPTVMTARPAQRHAPEPASSSFVTLLAAWLQPLGFARMAVS